MANVKWIGVALASLLTAAAFACAWDYDTVPEELKGVPDVVDAVIGRLEVNPPLYYEVRLKRVVEEMKTHPENLDLYDNAGVASDKLGDSDAAIKWMAEKAKWLKKSQLDAETVKDHQYRYHANLGTFLAHKWAKTRDAKNLNMLRQGISELETAVKINPDAHFGREIVQIKVLQMILGRAKGKITSESEFILKGWREFTKETGTSKTTKGLIGMMLLGAGAESPDMVALLGLSASMHTKKRDASLSYLVQNRFKELSAVKKPMLFGENSFATSYGYPSGRGGAATAYPELIHSAKEFRRNRDEFMLAKLKKGLHPDTDPTFWKGYRPTPAVNLDKFGTWIPHFFRTQYGIFMFGFGVFLFLIIGFYLWSNRRRKSRK